eukprot:1160705-Pelagomonas_calceolata.AAC.12
MSGMLRECESACWRHEQIRDWLGGPSWDDLCSNGPEKHSGRAMLVGHDGSCRADLEESGPRGPNVVACQCRAWMKRRVGWTEQRAEEKAASVNENAGPMGPMW